jgi:Starch synthase catalytic domain
MHRDVKPSAWPQVTATVDEVQVGYYHKADAGVDFVFVDHPSYQRPGGLYSDANGVYGDNQWRFKLLCQAALEACLHVELGGRGVYGQEPIFVANGALVTRRDRCCKACIHS